MTDPALLAPDAIRAGLYFDDGRRVVLGSGAVTVVDVDSTTAGDAVREAVAEGAPGAFISGAFDPEEPTRLVIPGELVTAPAPLRAVPTDAPSQASVAVTVSESADRWARTVREAAKAVASPDHPLAKVVLAREHRVETDQDIDPCVVLRRMAGTFPTAFHFSVGGIVGASPELLGQVDDGAFFARALAGTVGRDADPTRDAEAAASLLSSTTYRHEHALLARFLGENLAPMVDGLEWEAQPELLSLPNVHHLMTRYRGRTAGPWQGPGGLVDLVAAIHPTPAIAGLPQADAVAWIREHEPPRGRLGGYVGWTDAAGNGQIVLAIRCLELAGPTARLVVGNGIVGDSDPAAEIAENQAKARGVLDAVTAL